MALKVRSHHPSFMVAYAVDLRVYAVVAIIAIASSEVTCSSVTDFVNFSS